MAGGVLVLSWAVWYMWPGREVYMTCREVAAYFGEKLELNHGQFRYWVYSDVSLSGQSPVEYPLKGTYTMEGNHLVLNQASLRSEGRVRIMDRVNGVTVAWRDDGWALWNQKKEIHPYGVMIRTRKPLLPFLEPSQPSLDLLRK